MSGRGDGVGGVEIRFRHEVRSAFYA